MEGKGNSERGSCTTLAMLSKGEKGRERMKERKK